MTTQQFNFVIYQYMQDDGKSIEEAEDQRLIDQAWEEKLKEARARQIGKDAIIKTTQDKIIRDLTKNG
jgi:hypothetical protein